MKAITPSAERHAARGKASALETVRSHRSSVAVNNSFSRLARLGRLWTRLAQSPKWVNGGRLADWWARQGGAITGEQRGQLYNEACRSIFRGVLAGEFTCYGSHHPHFVKHGSVERILPAGPNMVTGTLFSGDREIEELRKHTKVLWLPAVAVKAWLATQDMKVPPWLETETKTGELPRTNRTATNRGLMEQLSAWFVEWVLNHPHPSEIETMQAANAEFPGGVIRRQMIRDLLKPPDGTPRRRGKKPGKSDAEHAQRMRT